ncbi:MAG: tRNA lysidine(34) synthetase TilS, partial [Mucilaginibacter polytrichastri]|nr:tRNA lysidine(34) synthetase TilS [Mucilaginibacter polytrichastri]
MLPVKTFLNFCRQNKLAEPGQRILATVSGGKDSVLMTHLLKAAGFAFGIAHVNFQLRGDESERDENFVQALAAELDVPFFTTRFNTKKFASENKVSTQMAARELRYTWFEDIRRQENYDLIATAHHLNDQLETILLNLVRGTGLA